MHRIDTVDAVSGMFVPGDPTTGQIATAVSAAWANAVQEEVATFIEGQGIGLNKSDNTQLAQAILSAVSGPQSNFIENGDFQIWQAHGQGPNSDSDVLSYNGPDRWLTTHGSASELSQVTRMDFAVDQVDVQFGTRNYLRWHKINGAGILQPRLEHRLEHVETLQGQRVSLGFEMFDADHPPDLSIEVELVQHFGTGGSPSADVVTSLGTVVVENADWNRYVFTVDLPSISGKTYGSNANTDYLALRFHPTIGQTFDIGISNVVLAAGSVAPLFPRRSFEDELNLCRRYFEKSYNPDDEPGVSQTSANVVCLHDTTNAGGEVYNYGVLRYKVRKFPKFSAIVWYHPSNGTADAIQFDGVERAVASSGDGANNIGWPTMTSPPATTEGQATAHWSFDAQI